MARNRLQGFNPEAEMRGMLDRIQDLFQRGPNLERRLLMALNASVQQLVEDVRRNSDLVKSSAARTEVMQGQITDLKAQLAAIVPGQAIDEENLNAIKGSVAQLEETNTALDSAVVEGVPGGTPTTTPLGDTSVLTGGTQPATHDAAGNPIPADAPGQPGQPPIEPTKAPE